MAVLEQAVASAAPETSQTRMDELFQRFGLAPGSARQAPASLKMLGLIARIGPRRWAATRPATIWLEPDDDSEPVRIVHAHVWFDGEILNELETGPADAAMLTGPSAAYGRDAIRLPHMRTRLAPLRECGVWPRPSAPVVTCRVLELARQPYYRRLVDPVTLAESAEAYLANALFDAHRDDPEFGYRFLADEVRTAGEPMAGRTAWRIRSANRWCSAFGEPRHGSGKRPRPPMHDDRVRRDITADQPNRLWLSDISDHRAAWIPAALRRLLESKISLPALRAHPEQFAMAGSMGRVASDNAAIESFFSLLQRNVLDRLRWETCEELRLAIAIWIERTYHRRRRQDRLEWMTVSKLPAFADPSVRSAETTPMHRKLPFENME